MECKELTKKTTAVQSAPKANQNGNGETFFASTSKAFSKLVCHSPMMEVSELLDTFWSNSSKKQTKQEAIAGCSTTTSSCNPLESYFHGDAFLCGGGGYRELPSEPYDFEQAERGRQGPEGGENGEAAQFFMDGILDDDDDDDNDNEPNNKDHEQGVEQNLLDCTSAFTQPWAVAESLEAKTASLSASTSYRHETGDLENSNHHNNSQDNHDNPEHPQENQPQPQEPQQKEGDQAADADKSNNNNTAFAHFSSRILHYILLQSNNNHKENNGSPVPSCCMAKSKSSLILATPTGDEEHDMRHQNGVETTAMGVRPNHNDNTNALRSFSVSPTTEDRVPPSQVLSSMEETTMDGGETELLNKISFTAATVWIRPSHRHTGGGIGGYPHSPNNRNIKNMDPPGGGIRHYEDEDEDDNNDSEPTPVSSAAAGEQDHDNHDGGDNNETKDDDVNFIEEATFNLYQDTVVQQAFRGKRACLQELKGYAQDAWEQHVRMYNSRNVSGDSLDGHDKNNNNNEGVGILTEHRSDVESRRGEGAEDEHGPPSSIVIVGTSSAAAAQEANDDGDDDENKLRHSEEEEEHAAEPNYTVQPSPVPEEEEDDEGYLTKPAAGRGATKPNTNTSSPTDCLSGDLHDVDDPDELSISESFMQRACCSDLPSPAQSLEDHYYESGHDSFYESVHDIVSFHSQQKHHHQQQGQEPIEVAAIAAGKDDGYYYSSEEDQEENLQMSQSSFLQHSWRSCLSSDNHLDSKHHEATAVNAAGVVATATTNQTPTAKTTMALMSDLNIPDDKGDDEDNEDEEDDIPFNVNYHHDSEHEEGSHAAAVAATAMTTTADCFLVSANDDYGYDDDDIPISESVLRQACCSDPPGDDHDFSSNGTIRLEDDAAATIHSRTTTTTTTSPTAAAAASPRRKGKGTLPVSSVAPQEYVSSEEDTDDNASSNNLPSTESLLMQQSWRTYRSNDESTNNNAIQTTAIMATTTTATPASNTVREAMWQQPRPSPRLSSVSNNYDEEDSKEPAHVAVTRQSPAKVATDDSRDYVTSEGGPNDADDNGDVSRSCPSNDPSIDDNFDWIQEAMVASAAASSRTETKDNKPAAATSQEYAPVDPDDLPISESLLQQVWRSWSQEVKSDDGKDNKDENQNGSKQKHGQEKQPESLFVADRFPSAEENSVSISMEYSATTNNTLSPSSSSIEMWDVTGSQQTKLVMPSKAANENTTISTAEPDTTYKQENAAPETTHKEEIADPVEGQRSLSSPPQDELLELQRPNQARNTTVVPADGQQRRAPSLPLTPQDQAAARSIQLWWYRMRHRRKSRMLAATILQKTLARVQTHRTTDAERACLLAPALSPHLPGQDAFMQSSSSSSSMCTDFRAFAQQHAEKVFEQCKRLRQQEEDRRKQHAASVIIGAVSQYRSSIVRRNRHAAKVILRALVRYRAQVLQRDLATVVFLTESTLSEGDAVYAPVWNGDATPPPPPPLPPVHERDEPPEQTFSEDTTTTPIVMT
ncbi:hypothetical protein ACA910_005362 [Epithemia clementina (nom. ined.)]